MIWERKACLSCTASCPHLSLPETMIDGCVQNLMASGNWSPGWSQTGGMAAAGRVLTRWVISSLCLLNTGFMQVGATFSPPSPLLVMTITPTIGNISAMLMCLSSSQKHGVFCMPMAGEKYWANSNFSNFQLNLVQNVRISFTQAFQFYAFHLLFYPHGLLHKSFLKIKSS